MVQILRKQFKSESVMILFRPSLLPAFYKVNTNDAASMPRLHKSTLLDSIWAEWLITSNHNGYHVFDGDIWFNRRCPGALCGLVSLFPCHLGLSVIDSWWNYVVECNLGDSSTLRCPVRSWQSGQCAVGGRCGQWSSVGQYLSEVKGGDINPPWRCPQDQKSPG